MSRFQAIGSAAVLSFAAAAASASTIEIDGTVYQEDELHFAASFSNFNEGTKSGSNITQYSDGNQALGAPDYVSGSGYLSLGIGGSVVLGFGDKLFTTSGDSAIDLYVIEIGSVIEGTFVEISKDGSTFFDVGSIGVDANGNRNYGIDLDAFGYDSSDLFSFVRLTDDGIGGSNTKRSGADIDAVAVTSFVSPVPLNANALMPVPLPAAGWLMLAAFGGLAAMKRRN